MKVEQAIAPTLDEFKSVCRAEFRFLVEEYGFREAEPPHAKHPNPFEAHFEKAGWRIMISGYSYGFAAGTEIRAPDGRSANFWHLVPIEFRTRREGFQRGQLGCIAFEALCVRTFGQAFITGEWSSFDELACRQNTLVEQNMKVQESAQREWKLRQAITSADEFFRVGRFEQVIAELALFEDLLSPAQRKKLEIARSRRL